MNTELKAARAAQLSAITQNYSGDFDDDGHVCIAPKDEQSLEADYALLAATKAAIKAQTSRCQNCFGGKYIYSSETDLRETILCPTCKGRGRVATGDK